MDCICQYLQWRPLEADIPPPQVPCNRYSSGYGSQIARRVGELFNNITDSIYGKDHGHDICYVIETERSYAMVYEDGGILRHKNLGSYTELLNYLSLPYPRFRNVVIDRGMTKGDVISAIYRHNKAGVIQV